MIIDVHTLLCQDIFYFLLISLILRKKLRNTERIKRPTTTISLTKYKNIIKFIFGMRYLS